MEKSAAQAASQHSNWIERFGLSQRSLAELRLEMPSGESLLRWCLITGKIPEADYLSWAANKYLLPIVKPEFFAIPTDKVFWENVKGDPAWSPSLIPLAQWHGVLQIACLEPPVGVRISGQHCFMLASAKSLDRLWAELHPGYTAIAVSPAEEVVKPLRMPPPLTKPTKPTAAKPSPDSGIVELGSERQTPPLPESSTVQELDSKGTVTESINLDLDVPEGMTAMTELLKPESVPSGGFDSADTIPGIEVSEDALEMPDGIAVAHITANLDFSSLLGSDSKFKPEPAPANNPAPSFGSLELDIAAPPPVAPQTIAPQPSPKPAPSPAAPQTISPRPVAHSSRGSTEDADDDHIPSAEELLAFQKDRTQISKVFDLSTLSELDDIKISAEPSHIEDVPPIPIEQCMNYDEVAAQALLSIKNTFEHGMILLFQGGQLRPWKWTVSLHSANGKSPAAIDLSLPSIFRIAYRTCLPYHGYVVPNPTNDAFFAEWLHGQAPRHITLVPLLVDGQMAGMLLGITNQPIAQKAVFRLMVNLAQEVSGSFRRLREVKAA